jgi:methionyl-tRNA formyltransferase
VPTTIQPDENAGDLLARLALLGVSLLNAELPALYSGTCALSAQTGVPTLAPKTSRSEARIDFEQDAKKVSDLIRAMNPEPMAWCIFKDEPMRILRARTFPTSDGTNAVGVVTLVGERVVVSCGHGTALELLEVQPSSRSAMTAKDWLNGQSDQVELS